VLKLGKKPFTVDDRDFRLLKDELLAVDLPPLPRRQFGHAGLFTDWGMLGNDNAGDCVWAGGDHETMLYNKLMHRVISFTPKNALDDYGAVTGYPATDEGTDVREAMGYRRTTGLIDALGQRHKIDAYIQIDAKDWETMIKCVWTFGVVGIGFEFPKSAWQEFDTQQPWTVHTGSVAEIDGGHYVPVVGSIKPSTCCSVITWGRRQIMTREFYEEYNDETWIPFSKESLTRSGHNFRHIDVDKLEEMLHSL
jgi:hypothetical protein